MKPLNKLQLIGIFISITFFIVANLFESALVGVPSGMLMAVGVALLLKWLPFKASP